MAKKSGTNAVKKIDEQINELKSNSTDLDMDTFPIKKTSSTKKTSTTKKTTTRKTSSREKVVVAPAKKKKTTTTKKTTVKNVRGGVVAPKKTTKTSTTKTIDREKVKNNLKTKKEKVEVVASREKRKKDLAEEVNKILEINDETDIKVESPKFIQEEKPKDENKTEVFEDKIKAFLEEEDQKEISASTTKDSLDAVDVIKFDKKEEVKPKKSQLKKKLTDKEYEDLKLEKPIDLEQIDKIEEYDIVEDFKKDVSVKKNVPKKQEFTRKRKGKGYVVNIKKKQTYQELESDLRSLYDKVNSVVGDFDENVPTEKNIVKKAKKQLPIFSIFKKKPSKKVEQKVVVPPVKKTKVVRETVIADTDRGERPSILDRISQRVLNFFLAVLFTIFVIMAIAFVAFVIYVSTF